MSATRRPGRHSPTRAWAPLSDAEWTALAPFLAYRAAGHPSGRPVHEPRGRLDAIFWLAAQPNGPRGTARWADLPARFGKPDTISRQFRRWAQGGLWSRLLIAVGDPRIPGHAALQTLESWVCRAYRRAWRLLGVNGVLLARRLGLLSALRAPPGLLPDPDLSARVQRRIALEGQLIVAGRWREIPRGFFGRWGRLLGSCGGRVSIPRRLAPP